MQGNEAYELVSQGAALMRVENDSMLQVAVQRPRDEQRIVKGALAELDLVPEEAKLAYYSLPFKERQQGGGFKVVKVEGPSIKAAMALARRWGNCTATARILNDGPDAMELEGVFIDMESNFRVCRPFRVSKTFTTRQKQTYTLDARRLDNAVQAGASKAIRNAILAGLPAYLVNAYDKKAREIVGGKLDAVADAKTIDAVLRAFEKMHVTKEQLERYAETPAEKWTGTEIADLRGLWNAIRDGQISSAEAFAEPEEGDPEPQRKSETDAGVAEKPISEPQLKRLFARAAAANHDRERVLGWIHNRYGCRVEDIPRSKYEAIVHRLDNVTPLGDLPDDVAPVAAADPAPADGGSPEGQKTEAEIPFE